MSDGMRRELVYLSSHATNRYFIPNWGIYFSSRAISSLRPIIEFCIYSCFCRKDTTFSPKTVDSGRKHTQKLQLSPTIVTFSTFCSSCSGSSYTTKNRIWDHFCPYFPFFTPETTYFPCKTPMLIDYSLLIVNNRSQHGIIEFLCIRSLTKDREHNGK